MAIQSVRRKLWRWAPGAFVFGFALSLALFGGSGYAAPDNVHPSVYSWAASHPGQDVPVIFETSGDTSALVSDVTSAGGSVERQFQIIPAVSAKVPVGSLAELSSDSSVAFVSLDAPVVSAGSAVKTTALATKYAASVGATDAWSAGYDGRGVGVAVVDTGITGSADFVGNASGSSSYVANRIVANVAVNAAATTTNDGFGHGTHIAGIIGGDGSLLSDKYIGIAPGASLINVKVADDAGNATLADVIGGMEFVYANAATYNIRVVNLSLNTSVAQSYKTDPLCAAAEALWFRGIFVVAAAGNSGNAADAVGYCPGNDPFVMTVGSIDDRGTSSFWDDVPTSWSSFGTTQDGFRKPELLTPGANIISDMDSTSLLYQQHPGDVVNKFYFSMSGTSMSAGVMSGVAALVLQKHPAWTPGQLKCTLVRTSRTLSGSYSNFKVPRTGSAVNQSTPSCNSDTGIAPSLGFGRILKVGAIAWVLSQPSPTTAALSIGLDPTTLGVDLSSVTASTVDWSSITWSSIKWSAITWSSIKWDSITWSSIKWSSIKWDSLTSDGVNFNAITWSSIKWDSIKWDAITWSSIKWDSIKWDAIKWDSVKWDFVENQDAEGQGIAGASDGH
jgi:serine protease AprX